MRIYESNGKEKQAAPARKYLKEANDLFNTFMMIGSGRGGRQLEGGRPMKEATAKCLRDSFCSDSMAHVRYLLYAKKATEESFPSIARPVPGGGAFAIHEGIGMYRLTHELIGTHTACPDTYFTLDRTMDNLERARNAESHEANEVVPAYVAVAGARAKKGRLKT